MSLPVHDTVMADLETILRGDPPFYHVYLYSPSNTRKVITLSELFQHTVPGFTQIQTLYFSLDIPSSDMSIIEETWRASYRDIFENSQGFISMAGGWAVEELNTAEVQGGKAKAFCIVEGWESEEKFRAFQKTEARKSFDRFGSYVKSSEACGVKLLAQD